jgi:class 3 adenylate cyclase
MGPTINRAARLRDLGHGGQTLLSGTATDLVREFLPEDAWLIDFGRHALRDLSLPERVAQLCHTGMHNDFPPLRSGPTNRRRR